MCNLLCFCFIYNKNSTFDKKSDKKEHVSVTRSEVRMWSPAGWSPDNAQFCAEVVAKLKRKDRMTYR